MNALLWWKYALHQTQPNSVDKCKTDIKCICWCNRAISTSLLIRFELLFQTVITRDSNQSSSPLKYISILCELPNKPTDFENQ